MWFWWVWIVAALIVVSGVASGNAARVGNADEPADCSVAPTRLTLTISGDRDARHYDIGRQDVLTGVGSFGYGFVCVDADGVIGVTPIAAPGS